MNTQKAGIKSFFTLLLLSISFFQNCYATEQQAIIEELLSRAELKEQVHHIAQFAVNEIENRKSALSDDEYSRLSAAIARAFDADRMYQTLSREFAKKFDAQLGMQWLDTLKSAQMKKISALERESSSNDMSRLNDFAQKLQDQPTATTRVDLVTKLDQVTRSTALAIASQLAVTKVILQTINPVLPANKQMTTEQMDKLLGTLKMQFELDLSQFSTIIHLYTYQTLSDEELAQYVALCESAQGQWMINATYDSIMQALTEAGALLQQKAQAGKSTSLTPSAYITVAASGIQSQALTY